MRFSKVINFDIDLGALSPMQQKQMSSAPVTNRYLFILHNPLIHAPIGVIQHDQSSMHSDLAISVEEIQVHHLLSTLNQQVDDPEHREKIDRVHSLYHQMSVSLDQQSGGGDHPEHHVHAQLQRICLEQFGQMDTNHDAEDGHTGSSSNDSLHCALYQSPDLSACLMGAIGGYHGEHRCHPGNVTCDVLVRCGIDADRDHNGQIDKSEEKTYGDCLRSHNISVRPYRIQSSYPLNVYFMFLI